VIPARSVLDAAVRWARLPEPMKERLLETDDLRLGAIRALVELFGRLRLDHIFVGAIASGCWLDERVTEGPIDVLLLTRPENAQQIPMMASHRGFVVDREAVEAARELDLVPMSYPDPEATLRIHLLMASNALYAKMITAGTTAALPAGGEIHIAAAEDLALMLLVGSDERPDAVRRLIAAANGELDLDRLNAKLVSIGLSDKVIAR
jgi:hypothetical protein